jgi:hypothetical protein
MSEIAIDVRNRGMRPANRSRRYLARHWLLIIRPLLRFSVTRDAYVLRVIGRSRGPVLRPNRRTRRQRAFQGADRRGQAA